MQPPYYINKRRCLMTNKHYSTVDLAKLIGVAEHRVAYAHRCGKLAEPELKVAGKRIYTETDARRVAAYFGVDLENTNG